MLHNLGGIAARNRHCGRPDRPSPGPSAALAARPTRARPERYAAAMSPVASLAANGDTETTPDSPAARMSRAWREMRRGNATAVLVERLFGRPGEPDSVEPGHLDVLDVLSRHDGQRMSELAAALRVDPSTVTRTMQRMEAAGLARRAATDADGRVVRAHLTDEGRRLHAVVAARRSAVVEAAFHDFSPEEQESLVELLERFLAAVDGVVSDRPAATSG